MSMPHENLQDQLYDIYDVWYIPFWQRPWFYWGALCLGFLIVSYIAWVLVRKYRSEKFAEPIPYWQQALDDLELLEQQNVATAQHGQRFYLALTIILKNYIRNHYAYNLDSKTDEELLVHLKEVGFDKKLFDQLEQIFQGGVFIKFANAQAIQSQIEQDLQRSKLFIQSTLPQTTQK